MSTSVAVDDWCSWFILAACNFATNWAIRRSSKTGTPSGTTREPSSRPAAPSTKEDPIDVLALTGDGSTLWSSSSGVVPKKCSVKRDCRKSLSGAVSRSGDERKSAAEPSGIFADSRRGGGRDEAPIVREHSSSRLHEDHGVPGRQVVGDDARDGPPALGRRDAGATELEDDGRLGSIHRGKMDVRGSA